MAKIVINMPDYMLNQIMIGYPFKLPSQFVAETYKIIRNGKILPKGHGKLIDAEKFNDAIYERFEGIQFYEGTGYDVYSDLKESIENSPTIIEADKRDEG